MLVCDYVWMWEKVIVFVEENVILINVIKCLLFFID